MQFEEVIKNRQSCRNYDGDRPVEREKLEKMIENARSAPSACNSQPYTFTVVCDREVADKLAKSTQGMGANKHCDKVHCFIVVTEEKAGLLARVGARFKDQEFAAMDIGFATSQLVLSATDLGLSTCVLGWFDEKRIKELCGIDESKRVRLVIAVGYAAADDVLREKKRKPVTELVKYI